MNITIINQPLNNRGDESANKALIKFLEDKFQSPTISLVHFDQDEKSISGFSFNKKYKHLNIKTFFGHFRLYRFLIFLGLSNNSLFLRFFYPSFFKIISKSDLIFCAPGGVCLGPYFNWSHLWSIRQVVSMNKKLIYFARSLGPFHANNYKEKLYNIEAKNVLKSMFFISIRDSFSSKVCKDLELEFSETIDSAFLIDYQEKYTQDQIFKLIGKKKYIVFVPNQLTWNFNYPNMDENVLTLYYQKILNLISKRATELNIVLLPQLFNHGEYNDVNYFRKITKGYDNVIIIDDVYSSDSQQKVISKAEFMIGSRYHSIIFSINNETPFIALAYEKKINGLLEKLDLNNFMLDFSFLNEQNIEKRNIILERNIEKIDFLLNEYLDKKKSFPHKKFMARQIAVDSSIELTSKI